MSRRAFYPRLLACGPRRGSVIVVVLVTLLLASMMLMKFIESSAVELTLATRQADRARLRADAYSALETALAVMAEIKSIDRSLHAPSQGWGDPYAYAGESPREGVQVSYVFTDESGKISLPTLSFDKMAELAETLGLSRTDARRFADGLYAWMTPDHTAEDIEAEASRYERDAIPHAPPKRFLRSWDELRAVRVARDYVYDEQGALTPFGLALRENISLYSFENSNVNALPAAVAAAHGWDVAQTTALSTYAAGTGPRPSGAPPWFRSIGDVTSVLGKNADVQNLDATVKLLRVEVTVREGAASMRLSTLVAVDKSVALPAAAKPAVSAPGDSSDTSATTTTTVTSRGGRNNGGSGANAGSGGGAQSGSKGRPGRTNAGAGSGTGRSSGSGSSGNSETSGGSVTSEEKLNYPFTLLEVIESAGPPPVAPVSEAESPAS